MAESYGFLPSQVLDLPASLFWLNAKVRQATNVFKNRMREQAEAAQSSAGAGTTPAQKRELVEANEDRADQREALDGAQPPLADQLDALEAGWP